MNTLKKTLLLLCYLTLSFGLSAQTVSGKLIDENSQPLPYANVVLLSLPDSTFVTGTISGEDGSFTLGATSGNQIVKISSIGYKTVYKPTVPANLGIVQLVSDAQQLGEVVVKADLPKTRVKGDAMVTTVAGSILENAGTGEDLLNKLPGVSADDGEVRVFGAGAPDIYINGRKVRDNSELNQLSSDNIKSVEVVNNPGSRYDATVNAVIRIKTKKPQGEGFGFDNRFYTEYRYDWTVRDIFDFNYRTGGFDLSGMLSGNDRRSENNKHIVQETFLDHTWRQESQLNDRVHTQNLSAMISLNYQFNENHSWGIRYNFDRSPKFHDEINMQTNVAQDNMPYEKSSSIGWQNHDSSGHILNTYYNGQVGEWHIDFNADGIWQDNRIPQEMLEEILPADGERTEQTVTSESLDKNTLYAAKLVAEHPLGKGNFSLGGEYTYTNRLNNYRNIEGILEDDESRIRENSFALFAEYAFHIRQLQVRAGVRYEHLASDYFEEDKRIDEQSRTYNNVFPSISLSLPVGKAQLQLSYTGSIYHPSYWMLRSNATYINRYTYEGGNPLLRPSVINRLSFNASYKWLYFNTRYIHGRDAILQLSQAYSEDDPTVSLFSFYNRYCSDKLYSSLTIAPTIGIWSPQLTLMLLQQWYKVDVPGGLANFNNPMGSFSLRNHFSLSSGFGLDIDFGADTQGDNENTYVAEGCWYANVGLYKSFFNERLSIRLQADDLFNSSAAKAVLYSGNRVMAVKQEVRRSIALTLRYKFNATKSKYKGTEAGDSQKSRM
ncbi:outer membrane beta-barrel protein [Phocaeicola sp.]|uniref:outer membrane beta-barrel protein n=1 Tax=Phocaeicola sp. TaxID=2773926 RepID=UPI003AB64715